MARGRDQYLELGLRRSKATQLAEPSRHRPRCCFLVHRLHQAQSYAVDRDRRTLVRAIIFDTFGAVLVLGSLGLTLTSAEQLSPGTYRGLTCAQIAQQGRSLSRKGFALVGLPAGTGGTNGSPSASAIIFIWPTPSSRLSDEKRAQLALAESQVNALENESVMSQCSIQFQRPPKD